MAKNWGKFLLAGAVIGAAVAGGIAYLNKLNAENDDWDEDFDDFDEFDDDFDEDLDEEKAATAEPADRSYVTIPNEPVAEEAPVEEAEVEEAPVEEPTEEA